MKLLIHTATGKTALIAFLIHFAASGWCFDGPNDAGQEFMRPMDQSNCSSNATTIHPLPAASHPASAVSVEDSGVLRKRSVPDFNNRLPLSATLMRVQGVDTYAVQSANPAAASVASALAAEPVKRLSLGLLLPHTTFKVREYSKAVQTAMISLRKQDLSFLNAYRFQVSDIHTDMLKVNPSPTGRLHCSFSFISSRKCRIQWHHAS